MEGKEVKPRFKKGFWKPEEDLILKKYVETHGEGNWTVVSKKSGLMRGAKSCRLRWKNYLRPNIKRGMMSEDEKDLIIRLHKLLGNRWSLIAGRLPGRTDNEVKNYWNTHLNKRASTAQIPHLDSVKQEKPKPPVQEENLETTMAGNTKEEKTDHTSVADSWLENLKNADYGMDMHPDYSPFFHNYDAFMPIVDDLVLPGQFECSVDEIIMQETIFL